MDNRGGSRELTEYIEVEAIMCGNNLIAIGAIRAAEEKGLHVPDDLGVTGFDHVPWADFARLRLTTVEIPAYQLGQESVHLLLVNTESNFWDHM